MIIPEAAIEAAAKAIFLTDYAHMGPESWEAARLDGNNDRTDAYQKAEAALEAALPAIEAALRTQIANDIHTIYPEGKRVDSYTEGKQDGIDLSAHIAEEGTLE